MKSSPYSPLVGDGGNDLDRPPEPVLQRIAQWIYLVVAMSVLTLGCSLLIVTAPAALVALMGVARQLLRGDAVSLRPTFFRLFRENFRQATIVGWILIGVGWMLVVDLRLAPMHSLYRIGLWGVVMIYGMVVANAGALMAHMRMNARALLGASFKLVFYKAHWTVINLAALYTLWAIAIHFPVSLLFLFPGLAALLTYACFERKVRGLVPEAP